MFLFWYIRNLNDEYSILWGCALTSDHITCKRELLSNFFAFSILNQLPKLSASGNSWKFTASFLKPPRSVNTCPSVWQEASVASGSFIFHGQIIPTPNLWFSSETRYFANLQQWNYANLIFRFQAGHQLVLGRLIIFIYDYCRLDFFGKLNDFSVLLWAKFWLCFSTNSTEWNQPTFRKWNYLHDCNIQRLREFFEISDCHFFDFSNFIL